MFLVLAGVLLGCVAAILAFPWFRKDPEPIAVGYHADQDQEHVDLAIEREALVRSLGELEVDHGQGRLATEDYARLKATDERRLIEVLDRLAALGPSSAAVGEPVQPQQPSRKWVPALVPTALVLAMASGIYGYLQWKHVELIRSATQQTQAGMPDPREMVARLESRLRTNPDDLEGQIMAGRSYMALDRIPEARAAWTKVLELDSRNHEAHYNLGVIMINTRQFDDPKVFQAALAHFDRVLVDLPLEPAVNWYRGLALWYLKQYSETEQSWSTAAQNLPAGSDDQEFVKEALIKLRAGEVPF